MGARCNRRVWQSRRGRIECSSPTPRQACLTSSRIPAEGARGPDTLSWPHKDKKTKGEGCDRSGEKGRVRGSSPVNSCVRDWQGRDRSPKDEGKRIRDISRRRDEG